MSLYRCLPVSRLGVPTALELGEKLTFKKKKKEEQLWFFTSKCGGRRNISFCLLTIAMGFEKTIAPVPLKAACLSTSDVCHTPFCPCSAVSQPHPPDSKSFAKQWHSSVSRRCTVKSGKFPAWKMETCPKGSSRQCSHLGTEPVCSLPKDFLARTRTVCDG